MMSPSSLCEIKDRIHVNDESKWKFRISLEIPLNYVIAIA